LKELGCDEDIVWLSPNPLVLGNSRVWVHYLCALFSPRAIIVNETWYNVTEEVKRGRRIKCSRCKKPGANLGCSSKGCQISCHFNCARADGWNPSTIAVHINPYFCKGHKEHVRKKEKRGCSKKLSDISGGRESVPVTWVNEVDEEPCPENFTYITRSVDSDSFMMNTHIHDLLYCNCEDNCVHPDKCTCLKKMQGKVYTSSGVLMPNAPPVIYECNTRCVCSVQHCNNRIVGKGQRFHLQLFKRACESGDQIDCSEAYPEWGVRSLDDIPEGGFVCEVLASCSPRNLCKANLSKKA